MTRTPTPQLSHADRRAQLDALMANYTGPHHAHHGREACHHQERVGLTGLDNPGCSVCGRRGSTNSTGPGRAQVVQT